MIGHIGRFRENDDLPLRRGPDVKKKPPFSNARALITRVKLCALGMRNAILGNDLNVVASWIDMISNGWWFSSLRECFKMFSFSVMSPRFSYVKVDEAMIAMIVRWSRHGAFSSSVSSHYLVRVLSRSFHRCPIKHNKRRKLKQGRKGQANLGGSDGMIPRKILKF